MLQDGERFAEGLWPPADHSLFRAVKTFTLSVFDATGAVTRMVSFSIFVSSIWEPFRWQSEWLTAEGEIGGSATTTPLDEGIDQYQGLSWTLRSEKCTRLDGQLQP